MAVVHEWLDSRSGSEKVFEAMSASFPNADLYALTRAPEVPFDLGGRRVATTMLDRPRLRARRELTLPAMPLAWAALQPSRAYDVVLTSSHACAKGFPAGEALHLCYCHTPMRYAWDLDDRPARLRPLVDAGLEIMRRWDRRSSERVHAFAANSSEVRDRIRRFYGREARVIPPPVDTDFYHPADNGAEGEPFVLAVSRFVAYKGLDIAVEAAARCAMPLVVAGSGPQEGALRRLAARCGGKVRFEIAPDDRRLRELYRGARALLFPPFEDFGIVPVEAQACGTPVIALDAGGTRDTVEHGVTGQRVAQRNAEDFASALGQTLVFPPSPEACRANAERFSGARFAERLGAWVAEELGTRGW